MVEFNKAEKIRLNSFIEQCREYRFTETRQQIIESAGLPSELISSEIPQLRKLVNSRIQNHVAPPIVGEMLRIESTYRHLQNINNYNPEQVQMVLKNFDRTIGYMNPRNKWFAINKMEQIYFLGGEQSLYLTLNNYPDAAQKVRFLNNKINDKKNPPLTPNYLTEIKKETSNRGIEDINRALSESHSVSERINLNEDKLYLIQNSSWNRSQKFLAKSQTYGKLYHLYPLTDNSSKALDAVEKCSRFFAAYRNTLQFDPKFKGLQHQEEWIHK